jgi:hypothetical protein
VPGEGVRSGPGLSFGILCAAVACHVGDEAYGLIPLFSYQLLGALWVCLICGKRSGFAKGYPWSYWISLRGAACCAPTRFCCFLFCVLPSLLKTGIMVFSSVSVSLFKGAVLVPQV